MVNELQLVERVRTDVKEGRAVSVDYAEDFSNFVYDSGNPSARQAVKTLCASCSIRCYDKGPVIEALIDDYVTGIVSPVALDDVNDTIARRKALLAFLKQFKIELEKSPAYKH
jgi:hypothetical protein